jgi:hypothetical protein
MVTAINKDAAEQLAIINTDLKGITIFLSP